jgi:hypothetical protein
MSSREAIKLPNQLLGLFTHCLLQSRAQRSDLSTSARDGVAVNLAQTGTRNLVFIFRGADRAFNTLKPKIHANNRRIY